MATELTKVTFPTGDYITRNESSLTWGGANLTGSYGCIDAALMDELGANRFQFIKASAITVEYSRDNGETWTDYGATDAQKQQIFAQGGGLVIGKADSTHKATEHPGQYQLRITINTGVAGVYSYLNKFVIYVSTNNSGNCSCKIQKALQSTPTAFVDHTDWIPVTGWSGYNVLNTSYLPTYGNTPSGQYGRVRFIFKDSTSTGTSYNGLTVLQIKAFGGVGWITPSTMAKTGHLYAINENQDAIFPANVTATKFIGALQGNADTATSASSASLATKANILNGFKSGGAGDITWGNQTGTGIWYNNDAKGGSVAFRTNNPASGQVSMIIDGTVYIKEGQVNVGGAVNSFSVNGQIVTYSTLWGNTGTFTTQDTKNTAGSTDTSSKIYLIGATSQAANPQTYSHDTAYVGTDGCLYSGGNKVLTSAPVTSVAGKTGAVTLTASDVGALASTTKYAGASTAGGSATSAAKLDTTTAGSATQPCYFASGVPSACTYSLNKTVPSNAVFTDEKVTQTESTTNSNYEILLSGTASTATTTGGSLKSSGLRFNPSKKAVMEGTATTASGNNSHAEGQATYASTTCAHAEGVATSATGQYSHAEGATCIASGTYSHAEGSGSRATYDCAHAEGMGTTANGGCSHAEGGYTLASNGQDHAEGYKTTANGGYSHAEGTLTLSSGNASHAEGFQTTANHKSQHVFGEYNLADASTAAATARGDYVEIVGNGLSSTQLSNARTLDWDGNEWLAGSLVASSVSAVDSNSNTNTSISPTGLATYTVPSGSQAISTGLYTTSDDIVLYSGTVTNTWDGTNSSLKTAIAEKLSKAGGTMTGAITTETGKWYTEGNYALHLNNSDMIGVNGIWFSDVSSDAGEGLMFLRSNGNWDDLYSVDGSLYYCANRTTAGSRGSAYTILHTGNGVLSNGGKYTGGNKTAGYCMHGVGAGHTYAVEWGSNLGFWVDVTKVATVSDRRLKDDIEPINMDLVKAIAECPSYQYKAFNRNGLISTGIIAQDLVENCKKYNVDPLKYELLDMEEFIDGDPTLYYHIEYDQLLYFKTLYLENKIKELEEKLCNLHKN